VSYAQIILINDGATDKTGEIIDSIITEDKAIGGKIHLELTHIKQTNQGQAKSFENVLHMIKGELVFLLDSDDRFLINKVKEVIRVFEDNPNCTMVTHPQIVINSCGKRTGRLHPELATLSHGDLKKLATSTARIIAPATTGLAFRSETFIEIHPSPAVRHRPYDLPDLYLALAASTKGPIFALKNPLSEYRKHPSGKFYKILSTIEGLESLLKFQKDIETRLSIYPIPNTNSFLARAKFAKDKLTSSLLNKKNFKNLTDLCKATWSEKNFSHKDKIQICLLMASLSVLPRQIFKVAWEQIVRRQTS
jgi:glycosyltransferase involved in cell wall biosynthesis